MCSGGQGDNARVIGGGGLSPADCATVDSRVDGGCNVIDASNYWGHGINYNVGMTMVWEIYYMNILTC